MRRSTAAVVAVRALAAVLNLALALPLVRLVGPASAGTTLATIAAMELASLLARLGVPVELARRRRLDDGGSSLPAGTVVVTALASGVIGAAIASLSQLPVAALIVGSVSMTIGQNLGGWQRGAGRFVLASLAHPVPALLAAVIGLVFGGRGPAVLAWWYVAGATTAAIVQVLAVRRASGRTAGSPSGSGRFGGPAALLVSARQALATAPLGAAGLANQALLLAVPVVLVHRGQPAASAVLSLALGAYRPLAILQYGLNFTVGPAVAGTGDRPLDERQLAALDRAAGLQQMALLPYLLLGIGPVALIAGGVGTGQPLPTLLHTWLVLLIGHAVAYGTGPTGQVLMMRGHGLDTVAAAMLGLGSGLVCLLVPVAPWLQAAGAITVSLAVQNLLTADRAMARSGWLARPSVVIPVVQKDIEALLHRRRIRIASTTDHLED